MKMQVIHKSGRRQKMIGIYLSGTGNTKHCIEKLTKLLDRSAKTMPLECEDVVEEIRNTTTILLGYPIQYSNAPYMVREKNILCCYDGRIQWRWCWLHGKITEKIWCSYSGWTSCKNAGFCL